MRKQIARTILALAATIPMTFMAVGAQTIYDDDIAAYSQELDYRIEQGRQSINADKYNNLRDLWNKIDGIRRLYTNKKMGPTERNNMMASLTNLDKELTLNLHDDQNARYQNWDPNSRSWRQNWWTKVSQNYNYDGEIDGYQRDLKQRLDRARSSGQLSPSELYRLTDTYNGIDRALKNYKLGGFSYSERNSLMKMQTQFDRDLTAQLRDEDNSRFRFWDPNKSTWNQKWWQPGWTNNVVVDPGNPSFNEEIDSYQRQLKDRIDRGRSQGRISPSELNKLSASYEQIDQKQRESRRGGFNMIERNQLMTMLTQLDREITAEARDEDNSRFRFWNPNNNTWNQNWWKPGWKNTTTAYVDPANASFNEEIDTYQKQLKQRIDRGHSQGKITPSELNRLSASYNQIDQKQQELRRGGFNAYERNSLMTMLTQLDREITTDLHDNENSHYQGWNSGNNSWNNNWWKNANNTSTPPTPTANPDARIADSNAFAEEVNAYQAKLRQEINRGQRAGQLTATEASNLNRQWDAIEELQVQTRRRGFTRGERDSLMQRLRELDNTIASNIRNSEKIGSAEARDSWKDSRDNRRDERRDDNRPQTNNTNSGGNSGSTQTPPAASVTPTTPANPTTVNDNNNSDRDDRRRNREERKQRRGQQ